MAAFSGLFDGVHGDGYAATPKADALPPAQRGIVRVLMQGRGMHGHVEALGRNAPATIARVDADRTDIAVNGTFNYPGRTTDKDVTVLNIGAHVADASQAVTESIARPDDATEGDMAHTYDTTMRNGHPADLAASGATSPAVTEVISDGT